jgi:transcriptional/translational regulatory protein YebC/TACO1
MFEAALDAGAANVDSTDDGHEVIAAPADLGAVREALEKRFGPPQEAKLGWRPKTTVPVGETDAETLFKLIDAIEDNDDVQSIFANYEIADAVLAKLTA